MAKPKSHTKVSGQRIQKGISFSKIEYKQHSFLIEKLLVALGIFPKNLLNLLLRPF